MRAAFEWFETRIDPFADASGCPPTKLLAFYWRFVRQAWWAFAAMLALGLVGALIELSLMAFLGALVDLMNASRTSASFFADHGRVLAAMALVALVGRPLVLAAHDLVKNQVLAGSFTTLVRWQTYAYVLRQPLEFFHDDFAGRIANSILQTSLALRQSAAQIIDTIWYVVVYFSSALAIFAWSDLRLTAPLLIWMVAYIGVLAAFLPNVRRRSALAAETRSAMSGQIVDSYANIMTVKLSAHTEREAAHTRQTMKIALDAWNGSLRVVTCLEIVLFALNGVLIVVMSGLSLWLWTTGSLSMGVTTLVIGFSVRIVVMSSWLMWTTADMFENIGIVQEGMGVIAQENKLVDKADALPLIVTSGEIKFENVRFQYRRAKEADALDDEEGVPLRMKRGSVIDDLTLTIHSGEKIGLVGRSGAGKSTLVNLLLRLYDLDDGKILIDGQDIALVTQESLRRQIGVVTQDTTLFHRSIRDNVVYGSPDADEAALRAATKQAQADDFVALLRDQRGCSGYEASVGDRGVKLSGGQRQRIAIARVLLKNAPIMVLDEATSALDSEVEAAIQKQLLDLMRGKTVIAIAHRLSTIAAMDRLVVLDRGRIVEVGSHQELLRRGGLYESLWARQSGGFVTS